MTFLGQLAPTAARAAPPEITSHRALFARARATASCGPAGPVLCNRPALYLNRRAARANGPCVASNAASGTPDAGGCAQIGSALRNGIGGGGIRFGPFCAPTLHKKWMIPRCVYQRVRVRSTGRQSGRISADCQVGRGRLGGEISTILKSTLLEPVICVLCQTQKCEIEAPRHKGK